VGAGLIVCFLLVRANYGIGEVKRHELVVWVCTDIIRNVQTVLATTGHGDMGLWDMKVPTTFRQSAHRWRWGCQPYAAAVFYPHEDFWYWFLLEAESTPGP
jgi:hypothetical protein